MQDQLNIQMAQQHNKTLHGRQSTTISGCLVN